MPDKTPDSISAKELEALLQRFKSIPSPVLSDTNPCELSMLIGMLIQKANSSPSIGHLAHGIVCLSMTIHRRLADLTARRAATSYSPDSTFEAVILSTMAACSTQLEIASLNLVELCAKQFDLEFDGKVGDDFLASIGISREEYEQFKERCSITH